MTRLETIEDEVQKLTPEEFAAFRTWLAEYDSELWDRQIERDITAGKLDALGEEALSEFERGDYTDI